jgi:hypothetical protein
MGLALSSEKANEWIKKMWYIYTIENYSAKKKNEIMSFAGKWMALDIIILSVKSQTQVNKGCRRANTVKYCIHMYENGKMRPVEAIPGMWAEGIKENDGEGEFNYDVFDIL